MKMYTRTTILLCFLFLTASRLLAQGYHIEATITGLKDSSLVIGHYNRSSTLFVPKDTSRADASGKVVFEGKTDLPGGLYVILFPGNKRWIELVYSGKETNFSIATDTADVVGSMKITGSPENQLFYTYQKELKERTMEIEKMAADKSPESQAKVRQLQDAFKTYRQKILQDNAGTFTVQLLKMSADPEIPAAPKLPNGKTDSIWVFNYYKAHYWDAFNFADGRIMNTPFLEPRLDRYIKNLVVQTPDSLIRNADNLIKKASANKDVKSFVVYYITNQYETPKTVGTEAVWVHMATRYYLSGEMGISEDVRKRVEEKVNTMKDLLVNKPFPALTLTDPAGKKVSVQTIQANYTILFFYSPTCGHCKEASPLLKAFYDKKKAEGIKVMAVSTEHNMEEWKSFISTYHLDSMINSFDSLNQIDFYRKFDVVTTPTIYVLDKNKKIIARKMPVEQLEDFLQYYQNKVARKL
ncbi:TlpA family protein disulfide reductase [Dyadobacter sandarakinus]|uniref:Redoxin domain-containing protein n=1 Tax=Dyadobacter sandarakinus TaxID=2747268 RepID=A0ABX7I7J9_9BACT|nr:TlpA family protein disulfide reductase [Dyadobacter sandarakinus]QRR02072.1 redoxin domain-containing protein [Dyadobacter sandarakinus]